MCKVALDLLGPSSQVATLPCRGPSAALCVTLAHGAILQKAGLKVPAGAVNVQEIFMATRNMCITGM